MPETPNWRIAVDEELGLLRIDLVGHIDMAVWRVILRESPNTPGFRQGLSSLVDAREAHLDFLYNDGQSLTTEVSAYLEVRGEGFRSAWVVSTEVDYGTTRMVQTILADLAIEAAVFLDMAEAELWATKAD